MRRKLFSGLLPRILLVSALLISMIFSGPACLAAGEGELAAATRLTIVHTNDTHSRVTEGDGFGFAKISAVIQVARKINPNILLLDAGDTFHGQTFATLSEGESIARIMNKIGYNAMVPGNHDFNYGYERLLELSEAVNFPILAANITKEDGTPLLEPYIIKEIAGLKVGIFGLSTPETAYKTHPSNVRGLTFADPVESAKRTVGLLRDRTDLIIALSHLGTDQASEYTSERVAREVEGIDLIVDGHSHTVLEHGLKVNGTLIVSTGEYGKNLGFVDIYYKNGKTVSVEARLMSKELAEAAADGAIASLIKTIEDEQAAVLSEVVGRTTVALEGAREKVRAGETNLGNLITDATLYLTGADCALLNGGGIRASIDEGEITKGEIISVLPFGNLIVTKRVTGADIKAALEHGTKAYPEPLGGFPHVAGIKYVIDLGRSPGDRVVNITVNGEPLDLSKEYLLATNDFLAAGGDEFTMFAGRATVGEYGSLDEALTAYIRAMGTVSPAVEGRITVQKSQPITHYYIVQPGDFLGKIARIYGTTWQKLQEINRLPNPNLIYPGQKLIVPNAA